jgi:hypothetical protein
MTPISKLTSLIALSLLAAACANTSVDEAVEQQSAPVTASGSTIWDLDLYDFPTIPACIVKYEPQPDGRQQTIVLARDRCVDDNTIDEAVLDEHEDGTWDGNAYIGGPFRITWVRHSCKDVTCQAGNDITRHSRFLPTGRCITKTQLCRAEAVLPQYDTDIPEAAPKPTGACECAWEDEATSALPQGWSTSKIGTGNRDGAATYGTSTFSVTGSGTLTGRSDTLNYAWQSLAADGQITARVSSVENTGDAARVGVMFRETLDPNSREVFLGLAGDGGYRWVRRTSTGGNTSTSKSGFAIASNGWVRLARTGNKVTAYKSADGATWVELGSVSAPFAANAYVGLAVASGGPNTLNASTFTDVTVLPVP